MITDAASSNELWTKSLEVRLPVYNGLGSLSIISDEEQGGGETIDCSLY